MFIVLFGVPFALFPNPERQYRRQGTMRRSHRLPPWREPFHWIHVIFRYNSDAVV